MALSEQLSRLAERTKQLEEHAAAARKKARADLEQEVAKAEAASKKNAEELRNSAVAAEAEVSAWWTDVGRAWDENLTKMRKRIKEQSAKHDLMAAQRDADEAAAYAAYVIDYTYAAVEEADYAVLQATLARMQADELAEKTPSS
ncbi:hypothetical protein ACWEOW_01280 [Monashia sp. NPDC004114]